MRNLAITLLGLVLCGGSSCTNTVTIQLEPELLSATQKVALLEADVVLLGEQHDNPFHHELQTQIVELLGRSNRLGALVFEQLTWAQQPLLDSLTSRSLASLEENLNWAKSGWPPFELYEPIFKVAIRYRSSMIAGNISQEQIKAIYKSGFGAEFSAKEQQLLGLDRDLPDEQNQLLKQEIFTGHCRMIPVEQIGPMIPIQRSRDAAMTLAWHRKLPFKGAAVFIVGSGHAHKKFGIPWYLAQSNPGAKIWSVGMLETGAEAHLPGAFDQTMQTAAAIREDPCEGLEAKLKKSPK